MDLLFGGLAIVIIALALCNPRLWRDMKSRHSSMDDVLNEGREDLKAALRSKKKDGPDEK